MRILLFIILLCTLYLFLLCPRLHHPDAAPFIGTFFAHRGLHDAGRDIPENSLTAFGRAVAAGCLALMRPAG